MRYGNLRLPNHYKNVLLSFQLHVESLCGQWHAVEMEYLAPRDGWFPLCILAPGR